MYEIRCINATRPSRCADGHAVACYPDLHELFMAVSQTYASADDGGAPGTAQAIAYRRAVQAIFDAAAARNAAAAQPKQDHVPQGAATAVDPRNGIVRCQCGCKYWDADTGRCVDCDSVAVWAVR